MSGGLQAAQSSPCPAPSLLRRMASMIYEGVLLFGVVMVFGYLYSALTQQRHALQGTTGLRAFLFVVLGVYFVGFWSGGGQTLAMKTWRLRVVRRDGGPVSRTCAFARYVLCWLWFLPALASVHYAGIRSTAATFGVLAIGMAGYLLLARLRTDRQFLHDVACGTQVVDLRSAPAKPAQSTA
jgi:uncharacterized RDD family membrane protein YckC